MKAAALILVLSVQALAGLNPRTARAFDDYVQKSEARYAQETASRDRFLRVTAAADLQRLRNGEVLIDKVAVDEVPDGLIHHWVGTAFVPGAAISDVLATVQDYNNLPRHYSPEVVRSRQLTRTADDFRVFMRTRKKNVITVVTDLEYEVHYGHLDPDHVFSVSRSTRVSEVENPGESNEKVLAPGDGHGFLFRMNTYWRFVRADGGVYVQCEAISLSRDIPFGLAWVIGRYIQSIPRQSLEFTLTATRDAAQSRRASR